MEVHNCKKYILTDNSVLKISTVFENKFPLSGLFCEYIDTLVVICIFLISKREKDKTAVKGKSVIYLIIYTPLHFTCEFQFKYK